MYTKYTICSIVPRLQSAKITSDLKRVSSSKDNYCQITPRRPTSKSHHRTNALR